MHQAAWYEDNIIPHDWSIGVSENGWTTNEIGPTRLNPFHEHTKDRTVGTHRLLVLDGHGSYVNPEFDQFCLDHKIIVGLHAGAFITSTTVSRCRLFLGTEAGLWTQC